MVDMLQAYIKIKTVGDDVLAYQEAISLFMQHANKDGLLYQKVMLDSGLPMLIVTVEGSDQSLKSLVLNHHMDVVSAENKGWDYHPFQAVVTDTKLYGRGTQDMKGIGVCHYYILKNIAKLVEKPKRTIHMIMVPDEEQGGFKGTGSFVKTALFKALNIGHVIDEGMPSGVLNSFFMYTAERKPLQIRISVNGASGHSSLLLHDNPVHTLLLILQQFLLLHQHAVDMCYTKSKEQGSCTSFHITSIHTYPLESSINIIPMTASATLDIRVAPDSSVSSVIEKINAMISVYNGVEWAIVAAAQDYENQQHEITLERSFQKISLRNGYVLNKRIFEGATDMRFYRAMGIEAIGCTPFEDPCLLHSNNEYVSYDTLYKGYAFLLDIVKDFSF